MEPQTDIAPDQIPVVSYKEKFTPKTGLVDYATSLVSPIKPIQSANFQEGLTGWRLDPSGEVQITGKIPASATAVGVAGTIVIATDYIYVCTATDTWKRVAIATW
jgi:hypothetical protein